MRKNFAIGFPNCLLFTSQSNPGFVDEKHILEKSDNCVKIILPGRITI